MQYSDALSIIPVSKLPISPGIGSDEPTLNDDEGKPAGDDKEPTTDEY